MIFLQFQVFPTPPVTFIFDFFSSFRFSIKSQFCLALGSVPSFTSCKRAPQFPPSNQRGTFPLGFRCTATTIISSGPVCTQTVMFLKGISTGKITGVPGTGRWSPVEASLQLTREKSCSRGKKRKSRPHKRTPFHPLWVYLPSVSFECRDKSILFE